MENLRYMESPNSWPFDVGGWEGATEDLATTKSACPNVPPLSYIGLWLRRIIPPNDVAFPTLKQTMKLEVVGGGGTLPPSTEPPPVEPPPTEPPPTEPPPGGGGKERAQDHIPVWQTTRIYYSKRYQALSSGKPDQRRRLRKILKAFPMITTNVCTTSRSIA